MDSYDTGSKHSGVVLRTLIFALIALVCFSIAAFALELWPAFAHHQSDYANKGTWSAWFSGPVRESDQETVKDTLPEDARVVYSLTGYLKTLSSDTRHVSGSEEGLRYYLAPSEADGKELIGTWVASDTLVSGSKQASTPVIIDSRTADKLHVGVGDTITLEAKVPESQSNDVQGRFNALITAVARPTKQFRGVALVSDPMTRVVRAAAQLEATDFYLFDGRNSTPQDMANALASDKITGVLRSEMLIENAKSVNARAALLRYAVAGAALLILGVYTLGELYFSSRRWKVAGKDGLFSVGRVQRRKVMDLVVTLVIFVLALIAGVLLAGVLIRSLLGFEPTLDAMILAGALLAALALVFTVARALMARRVFKKRSAVSAELEDDHA